MKAFVLYQNGKLVISRLLTVFFVVITFVIPLTSNADPPVRCPCFTTGEIMRDISKVPPGAEGFVTCSQYVGIHMVYTQTAKQISVAEVVIPTDTGFVAYSMHGSVPYGNRVAYPSCGTGDSGLEAADGYPGGTIEKARISIITVPSPSADGLTLSAEHQACMEAIIEACTASDIEVEESFCRVMGDPWYYQYAFENECQ